MATRKPEAERHYQSAREYVLAYLREHGPTPAEQITDAARAAGAVPSEYRGFGIVFHQLFRERLIRHVDFCWRRNGRDSRIWDIR
jgi:hypothetical protein